jgi:pectin methylesterase-like acyl-CoA thioesterase
MEFFFELCGTVSAECGNGVVDLGTAIQRYSENNGQTDICQVIGHGAPLYSPWGGASQVSDVAPAGINISFIGQPADENT